MAKEEEEEEEGGFRCVLDVPILAAPPPNSPTLAQRHTHTQTINTR